MKDVFSKNSTIKECIERIGPLDEKAMEEARERQDFRVKVPGSLGVLEDISIQMAGITGKVYGNEVSDQAIILMCGDNGVVEEGVASAPQTVTQMQTINFTKRITGVGSQAEYFGIDLLTVDVGVKLPIPQEYLTNEMLEANEERGGQNLNQRGNQKGTGRLPRQVVDRRIANGTKNFALEPAMSETEVLQAIETGIEAANACKITGKTLIGIGEMGIGNTTTASAIICALTDKDPSKVVGRGGGLSDDGLKKKSKIIGNALSKYQKYYVTADGNASAIDPVELLRCVGGFDIAAMVGAYLGGAANRMPMVIDGMISMAAAMLAVEICKDAKAYMFASHKSKEGGYGVAAEAMGLSPMFDLGMRLGEGSGCPIAFKIIEAACAVMNNMKSLKEAQVDGKYLDEFRQDGQFN